MYDAIIVGMGPAGMSAGIYAKRDNMKVLLLDEKMPGESLTKIKNIDNYLGFPNISGTELAIKMFEHIEKTNVEYKIERVKNIIDNGEYKSVYTTLGEYKTRGVIIAGGRKYKKTGLKNEDKYLGKGLSYCAVCDAPLYKDKTVCVVGNNSSAYEEAEYLCDFAKKVILVTNEAKIDINPKIQVVLGKLKEFIGSEYISGIILNDETHIECDGVFINYGTIVDTSFIMNLGLCDDDGYIMVDQDMKTKIDKIYACGDIIKKGLYQISTAVGEGAIAATSLKKELDK